MSKPKFIAVIEQNHTRTRCLIINQSGRVVASASEEHRPIVPQTGRVEADPGELWYKTKQVYAAAMDIPRLEAGDLAALGVTTGSGTTVVWNSQTGEPYYKAIAAPDTRTDETYGRWSAEGWADEIRSRTGLSPAADSAAARLKWLLENVTGLRQEAEQGRALFGGLDSWLIRCLTGAHVTDCTNASRTLLWNLQTGDWDREVLERLSIPSRLLPQVRPSSDRNLYGYTRSHWPFGGAIAVSGSLGAEQAALFGEACFRPGEAQCTFDAGCKILVNTGRKPVRSEHGLNATAAYALERGQVHYALEAHMSAAAEAGRAGREESGATGSDASFDAICYGIRAVVEAVGQDLGVKITALRVDGEAARDDRSMQSLADILGIPVVRPAATEVRALGAAYAAGLAVGYWADLDAVRANWQAEQLWEPSR